MFQFRGGKNGRAYLTLDEMTYPCLRHDGNSHRVHDLLDHLWV